ncbi:MAG TPA: hypothetical protein VFQ53_15900 [Kofleriaceae bacterium]|nr:hypothetical protein [Kofleriaceae bacterium]
MRWILLVTIASCARTEEAPPSAERAPEFRASYGGSLTKLADGGELVITARDELRDPTRQALEIELDRAMARARPCMEGIYGTVFAHLELDANGRVTKSHVESPLLEGTPIARCIEDALRTMTAGKLAGAPIEIRYPVRNMPSAQQVQEAAAMIQKSL